MSPHNIRVGSVIFMRTIKPRLSDADGKLVLETTYTAPKGQTFVLMAVGLVDLGKASEFDVDACLMGLGWTPPDTEAEDILINAISKYLAAQEAGTFTAETSLDLQRAKRELYTLLNRPLR